MTLRIFVTSESTQPAQARLRTLFSGGRFRRRYTNAAAMSRAHMASQTKWKKEYISCASDIRDFTTRFYTRRRRLSTERRAGEKL